MGCVIQSNSVWYPSPVPLEDGGVVREGGRGGGQREELVGHSGRRLQVDNPHLHRLKRPEGERY